MNRLFRLLPILLLAGCATTQRDLPDPPADAREFAGQLRYQSGESSVIGEVVIRAKGDDFSLTFLSGPGFPLMKWQQSGSDARAEGVLARRPWQGDVAQAPESLRGWAKLSKFFAFSGRLSGTLKIRDPETNESFSFVFSR